MSDYNFIIDIESRRLIADYFSTEAGTPPTVIFGDQPTVNVQLVESNNDNAEHPWKSVALTGQSIRIGVGSLEDATPSAYIELTADLAAASSVITEVRAGVLNTTNEIQRVQILDAVKGNYTITIAGETTTPLSLDASLEEITDAIEALASITADSVDVTGNPTDYRVEFDSSLADVGAITVNLDNITSRVGKTGTLDLHVEEILTLLDDETSVEATLEVVRWTTADVAGETVLQVPVTVKQDVIPDTVPGTTPLPGYATIDLDHINQSGAATGQIPTWNGSEWVPSTVSGTGDLLSTANLSDLADIPTARTNLGLGTAATSDSGDFAGAAHTHTASDIDAEASTDGYVLTSDGAGNAVWEASTGGSGHDPVTVTDSAEIDFTLAGQDITASLIASSIDEAKLDASVNASLDLADSASQPGHTHVAGDVTDFDAEVSNNTDVAANTSARHDAVTVTDSSEIDFTLTGQDITASLIASSIDETKLDASTNASLDLADSASQPGHTHVASTDIVATGTPSSTTYLRGDDTWATVAGGGSAVSISETAPSSPSAGDMWFDSSTAKMYVYYTDADSSQWVSVTSGLPTPDSKTGWMDYNDSTGSFSVAADTWTNVPNNGAGAFTNKTYKPPSVTEVLDTTTGHLDFSDLPLGSEITLRNDITVVPNSNNALLQMRYVLGTGAGEYGLNFLNDRLDSGSGVTYQKVSTFPIYMGDTNTKNNAGKLQIKMSVAGTVTNSGVYASIQLY